jgi:hypothetical protein
MSSKPKRGRPRLRYRAGFAAAPRCAKRAVGGTALSPSDYSVSSDLPESIPVTEHELRAVEMLLGRDLKELLVAAPAKSLKYREK